jgi:putative ABC transport system permease protein
VLLRLRPWRYGPALLLRRPGVALALAAAGFVAALPAAAAPLFLSAAQDATLHHQTARSCPWDSGLAIRSSVMFAPPAGAHGDAADRLAQRQHEVDAATTGSAGLSAPVTTLISNVNVAGGGKGRFTVRRPSDAQVELPVAGVYTDLRLAADDRYWCSLRPVWQGQPGHEDSVLPTVLADPESERINWLCVAEPHGGTRRSEVPM